MTYKKRESYWWRHEGLGEEAKNNKLFFKCLNEGLERWLRGSENLLFFKSVWVWVPALTWQFRTICSSGSGKSGALSQPQEAHMHIQTSVLTHKIKLSKKIVKCHSERYFEVNKKNVTSQVW